MSEHVFAIEWTDSTGHGFGVESGVCTAIVEASPLHRKVLTSTLATLAAAEPGHVRLLGADVGEAVHDARAAAVYCSLDAGLHDELSAHQYLSFCAELWQKPSRGVSAALELCGLIRRAERRLDSLTATERGLVHVARALLVDPPLFLLDGFEAAALGESDVLAQLLRELVEYNKTCVLFMSRLLPVAASSSQAIVMADGRAIFSGSMTKLNELLAAKSATECFGVEISTSVAMAQLSCALGADDLVVSPTSAGAIVRSASGSDAEALVSRVSHALLTSGLPFSAISPVDERQFHAQLRNAVGYAKDG